MITERHVQAAWYDPRLRPDVLFTTCGERVIVENPGEWNVESGPDFHNARLQIGGQSVTGDVEIHLRPGDWHAHGHTTNPAYAHVILHVTWFEGAASEPACPHLVLGNFVSSALPLESVDLSIYPYQCPSPEPPPADATLALLANKGRNRLHTKAQRFTDLLKTTSAEQLFYAETLHALGYKYNSFPFRALAERVPVENLPQDAIPAQRALEVAAAFAAASDVPWKRDHVRPNNTPERRLAAAARLFSSGSATLLNRLLACDLSAPAGQHEAVRILRFADGKMESPIMGKGRAGAIITNVLIPFACAIGRLTDIPDWIAPEDVSRPVRLAAARLLGRDANPTCYARNGLLIQGLLAHYLETTTS